MMMFFFGFCRWEEDAAFKAEAPFFTSDVNDDTSSVSITAWVSRSLRMDTNGYVLYPQYFEFPRQKKFTL